MSLLILIRFRKMQTGNTNNFNILVFSFFEDVLITYIHIYIYIYRYYCSCPVVAVQGYDTSLSKTDIKKVLSPKSGFTSGVCMA